jgi:hypothetical protein
MKKLIIILTLITGCFTSDSQAQNWNEWFKQKKTQRRYLIKQIALLKVYITQVKKGITVVRRGLNTVENVKNGEFNLHKDFFSYLNNVNPAIANSAKVADIIAYQVFIMRQLNSVNRYCRNNKQFTPEEVRYVGDVYTNMLVLCDANLAELLSIIRSNKTKMTDDERLGRIDWLHEDMLDKQRFVKSFDRDVRYIGLNREHEQLELDALAVNYGLSP